MLRPASLCYEGRTFRPPPSRSRGSASPGGASPVQVPMPLRTDFLVLGSGVAGLSFALRAARHGHVTVAPNRAPEKPATNGPQGGGPAALDPGDSYEKQAT